MHYPFTGLFYQIKTKHFCDYRSVFFGHLSSLGPFWSAHWSCQALVFSLKNCVCITFVSEAKWMQQGYVLESQSSILFYCYWIISCGNQHASKKMEFWALSLTTSEFELPSNANCRTSNQLDLSNGESWLNAALLALKTAFCKFCTSSCSTRWQCCESMLHKNNCTSKSRCILLKC